MTARYAQNTTVDSHASRAEIERILTRYGASSFMYGWKEDHAVIAFTKDNRNVRFILPMPDRNDRRFTHTPSKGLERSTAEAEKAYEQAVRQSWRALALVVKAKFEAVEAGIVGFEQEFFAHIVLPNNSTVYEEAAPAVETAYRGGGIAPLLQIGK